MSSESQSISITAQDGGVFSGYLGIPAAGVGPGLLILQEIFGVNAHIRALVDRYAEEGYLAMAPDLFWRMQSNVDLGFSPEEVSKAREFGTSFDNEQGVSDIGSALEALRGHPGCNGKVGVIGFCMGGRLAFLSAARLPVDAAISYYGTRIEPYLGDAKSVRCPIMFHFGGRDQAIPSESREG
ncbi:MAG: Carboxymethylenebutenolidase, partial [Candidatus Binatus sp.]|nr:Carboxymethylenebutenolidase [Candidatus Binatus sp.]